MKYANVRIVIIMAVCLFSAQSLEAKEWRGIVPLKSTRADVEKVLGKPNGLGRYEFENERAYIDYAVGCNQTKDCLCVVPKDTVISIFVTLESDLKLSELKIDRTKYKPSRSAHLPSILNFVNDEEGISYTVDEKDDEVMHITYLPTSRDCQKAVNRARNNKKDLIRQQAKHFRTRRSDWLSRGGRCRQTADRP